MIEFNYKKEHGIRYTNISRITQRQFHVFFLFEETKMFKKYIQSIDLCNEITSLMNHV